MRKTMVGLLAGAMFVMAAGSAFATPIPFAYNNRPVLTDLTVLANTLTAANAVGINVVADQSKVGAWQEGSDGNSSAYRIAAVSNLGEGQLQIFSLLTGTSKVLFDTSTAANASFTNKTFSIEKDIPTGNFDLIIGSQIFHNFGTQFGFKWVDSAYVYNALNNTYTNTSHSSSTLDSMNGPAKDARALSYQLQAGDALDYKSADGTHAGTYVASGNNDWMLAFDNYFTGPDYFKRVTVDTNNDGKITALDKDLAGKYTYNYVSLGAGDTATDFNDAVFIVEDINPVPEPGTMMLLGLGMLGMAVYGKRRMNKQA